MMNEVNWVNEVNGELGESVDFVSVDVKCKKGQKVKKSKGQKLLFVKRRWVDDRHTVCIVESTDEVV